MPVSRASAGPHFPSHVGRYELMLPIASGGMATVYLARASGPAGFERDVALKLTHAFLRESPELAAHVIDEAKLAARIRHPNVVSIVDVGEDPEGIFLVMDYVEGETLSGLRRVPEPVPRSVGARILVDSLAGLHAAHELRDDHGKPLAIVHRDFSPQNILVGIDGTTRLSDFGIAKASNRLGQTRSGIVKGKVAYMAPEQARGEPIDRRCDVWAAGVVAWELFSGQRLYAGLEDVATIVKIITAAPPRLREVVPGIHPAIDEAVARALTFDVNGRTGTAQAFARELVAACHLQGGIADTEEVAELVRERAGAKLAQRRKATSDLARARAVDPNAQVEIEEVSSVELRSVSGSSSVDEHTETTLPRESNVPRAAGVWHAEPRALAEDEPRPSRAGSMPHVENVVATGPTTGRSDSHRLGLTVLAAGSVVAAGLAIALAFALSPKPATSRTSASASGASASATPTTSAVERASAGTLPAPTAATSVQIDEAVELDDPSDARPGVPATNTVSTSTLPPTPSSPSLKVASSSPASASATGTPAPTTSTRKQRGEDVDDAPRIITDSPYRNVPLRTTPPR